MPGDAKKKKKGGATIADKVRFKRVGEWMKVLREQKGRQILHKGKPAFLWDPESSLNNARGVIAALMTNEHGHRLVHAFQGVLYRWIPSTGSWDVMPDAVLRRTVWSYLDSKAIKAKYEKGNDPMSGDIKIERVSISQRLANEIVAAIRDLCFLDTFGITPPFIVKDMLPLPTVVVGKSKTVDLVGGQSFPNTPAVFVLNRLPFDLDLDADEPERWMTFLREVFPGDQDAIDLLQEWFGYVISGRTNMQKALFVIGPKRSGKGTICNVLKELIGPANYGATSLAQIGGRFGLADLMTKSLAVMSDVRVDRLGATTTERILTITGEDTIAVERKHQADLHTRLGVRLMIATNEAPQFDDVSGALVSRFLTIEMKESFYGREDHDLLLDLRAELPGIMSWAVEGLRRLERAGRFTEPSSGNAIREQLGQLASPISAWLEESCELGAEFETDADELRMSYSSWCAFNKREALAPNAFGSKLKAATGGRVVSAGRDSNKRRVYVGVRLRDRGDGDAVG